MGSLIHIRSVRIPFDHCAPDGCLNLPEDAESLVIFINIHDSGCSDNENKFIGRELNFRNIATLFVEINSIEKNKSGKYVSIEIWRQRLYNLSKWIMQQKELNALPVILFEINNTMPFIPVACSDTNKKIRAGICMSISPNIPKEELMQSKIPYLFITGADSGRIRFTSKYFREIWDSNNKVTKVPEISDRMYSNVSRLKKIAEVSYQWIARNVSLRNVCK